MLQTDLGDYQLLKNIGLGRTAAACYESLLRNGRASVPQLAERLGLPRTGLYRVLEKLTEQGFLTSLKTGGQPTYYHARPLDEALTRYFNHQKKLLSPLLKAPNPKQSVSRMSILHSQEEILSTYVRLASKAEHDLLTISIGEEMPEAIYQVSRDANSRGVTQYLLFQRHTKENDRWIKRWLAYGCQVRLIEGAGYHLNIIDRRYAILSSSNTENSHDRTAVIIESAPIIAELRRYFFGQWNASQKLSKL